MIEQVIDLKEDEASPLDDDIYDIPDFIKNRKNLQKKSLLFLFLCYNEEDLKRKADFVSHLITYK